MPRQTPWPAYIGLMMSVGTLIFQAGVLGNRITSNTDRIVKLEASELQRQALDEARADKVNAIDVRTARIEAKLDFLLPKETR